MADLPPLSNPDLVIVARKFPQAVVCLVSALAFHELTTQVPHAVDKVAFQVLDAWGDVRMNDFFHGPLLVIIEEIQKRFDSRVE